MLAFGADRRSSSHGHANRSTHLVNGNHRLARLNSLLLWLPGLAGVPLYYVRCVRDEWSRDQPQRFDIQACSMPDVTA